MRKNWILKTSDKNTVDSFISELHISHVTASILASRGFKDPVQADEFVHPKPVSEPDPMLMTDMNAAVKRIRSAMSHGEIIGVIGDYDVDGITATAILYKYFSRAGVNVFYHIPSREGEGYGISNETLMKMKQKGCSLVISVDCGITAVEEAEYAKAIGLDLIVTDHHEVGEIIPDCVAVINPKRPGDAYPYNKLSGVGVAYKLICAIGIPDHTEEYIAFAALGTLADMMPVTGENRNLITKGMQYICSGVNTGLSQLMNKAGVSPKRFNSFSVSFILAPRMNAAGRIESAETALKLLLEDDEYTAGLIAEKLCALNKTRQETEAEIFRQAIEAIESDEEYKDESIIVLYNENWHQGVIGIVAAKITEKYEKPAILFTLANGTGKGSGRSVSGFSIHKAVSDCAELLSNFGGHEYAVGLGIEIDKIPAFRKKINALVSPIDIPPRQLEIDAEIYPEELSIETVRELKSLEPYGEGNPQPVFLLRDAKLTYLKVVGEKHTRISLRFNGYGFDAIYYNTTPEMLDVSSGDSADIAFTLGINEYNGQENLQIVVKDISPAGTFEADIERFRSVKASGVLEDMNDYPEFSDFECVYRALLRADNPSIRPDAFAAELSANREPISTLKLMIILSVFSELSLIKINNTGLLLDVSVIKGAPKTDLNHSELLRRLKQNDRT